MIDYAPNDSATWTFFPSRLESMSLFALKTPVSASDRMERRRLIFADTLSLVILFAVTTVLAVLTNYLYQSYASHQVALAKRWLERGDQAMRDKKPQAAIDALSSALAYAPSQRAIEIKLAEALASAGRVQEATVYFNALLESQQGNGLINLQLARLAALQGNVNQAIDDYQKAIYGNWEGDGYVRRREVRFELINYLIAHQMLDRARSELLVASGNAPEDDLSVQLQIARSMEQAQDPGDALHLYRVILHRHPSLRDALEGAGRTAFQMGRYLDAKHYLSRALEGPAIDQEPQAAVEESRDRLNQATRLLLLYPSSRLSSRERNARILSDRKIALARLAQCTPKGTQASTDSAAANVSPSATPSRSSPLIDPLQSLASRFSRHPAVPAPNQTAAAPAVDPLQTVTERWKQLPASVSSANLEQDPDLAQTVTQLIYDTETATQQVCGAPKGDDALLLKIAQGPNQVEEE
jgi:tetratricopeptide (TPR) repeat protein